MHLCIHTHVYTSMRHEYTYMHAVHSLLTCVLTPKTNAPPSTPSHRVGGDILYKDHSTRHASNYAAARQCSRYGSALSCFGARPFASRPDNASRIQTHYHAVANYKPSRCSGSTHPSLGWRCGHSVPTLLRRSASAQHEYHSCPHLRGHNQFLRLASQPPQNLRLSLPLQPQPRKNTLLLPSNQ